jgi:hypothetical protein
MMIESNLARYKTDLEKLVKKADLLYFSLLKELDMGDDKVKKMLAEAQLPSFAKEYDRWYSEALEVIKQILPDRVDDFRQLYKNERRRDIDNSTYTISDFLTGITVSRGFETVVDRTAVVPKFQQQQNILKSAEGRFESSLYEIRQILQADLFDNELEAARELVSKGFVRGAGAVAGVVLEAHLGEVCGRHNVRVQKKNPKVSDLNDALKNAGVIEVATWRFIQHLADLRNLCDHKKHRDPTAQEITELIDGVAKVSKTVY